MSASAPNSPSEKKPSPMKGKRKRSPSHVCRGNCYHTCGEVGGVTAEGTPCTRPGGWGIKGKKAGSLTFCKQHDPEAKTPGGIIEGLTWKEAKFVMAYCGEANGNGVKAAEISGHEGSYGVRATTASNLLKKPKIKAAINQWFEERSMPAAEITARLTGTARLQPDAMVELIRFDKDGNPEPNLTPDTLKRWGHLIKEVKVSPKTGKVIEVKLHDTHSLSLSAQRELAKIRQLYSDAPQVDLHVHLQTLSDEQIMEQLTQSRRRLGGGPINPASPDEKVA